MTRKKGVIKEDLILRWYFTFAKNICGELYEGKYIKINF